MFTFGGPGVIMNKRVVKGLLTTTPRALELAVRSIMNPIRYFQSGRSHISFKVSDPLAKPANLGLLSLAFELLRRQFGSTGNKLLPNLFYPLPIYLTSLVESFLIYLPAFQ